MASVAPAHVNLSLVDEQTAPLPVSRRRNLSRFLSIPIITLYVPLIPRKAGIRTAQGSRKGTPSPVFPAAIRAAFPAREVARDIPYPGRAWRPASHAASDRQRTSRAAMAHLSREPRVDGVAHNPFP